MEFVTVRREARAPLLIAVSQGLSSDELLCGFGERMELMESAAECLHKNNVNTGPTEKWQVLRRYSTHT